MRELPDWMQAYINTCCTALGLDHTLTLYFKLKDLPQTKNGDNQGGLCDGVPRYHYAKIQLSADLAPDDEGYEVITHELTHAALPAMGQAVDRIIDLVPKKLRKHALELWDDGQEPAVTRLAAALTPILRAAQAADNAREKGSADDGEVPRVAEGGEHAAG